MSGGSASGSCTAIPTRPLRRLPERANVYASGIPNTAMRAVEMLAPSTDTRSALHRPGVPNPRSWDPAKRMRNAATGTTR